METMHGLHENQKKILEYLQKQTEGATLEQLSSNLEISKTATKEHLLRVDGLGLIRFEDRKGDVGRPKRHYFLSPEGQESFPRQYSWLSNSLLKLLAKSHGDAFMSDLMGQLAQEVTLSLQHRFNKINSIKERINLINEVMNELGYKSIVRQRDLRKGAVLEAAN